MGICSGGLSCAAREPPTQAARDGSLRDVREHEPFNAHAELSRLIADGAGASSRSEHARRLGGEMDKPRVARDRVSRNRWTPAGHCPQGNSG